MVPNGLISIVRRMFLDVFAWHMFVVCLYIKMECLGFSQILAFGGVSVFHLVKYCLICFNSFLNLKQIKASGSSIREAEKNAALVALEIYNEAKNS